MKTLLTTVTLAAGFLVPGAHAQTSPAGGAQVTIDAPSYHVVNKPYKVRINLEAPAQGATIEGWRLTGAGFTLNGSPLGDRGNEPAVVLGPNEKKTIELDLGRRVQIFSISNMSFDHPLAWGGQPVKTIRMLVLAPANLTFMDEAAINVYRLGSYWVLLRTSQGDMLLETWPMEAPRHVRNFLDLSYSGFYDGSTFHRVMPGFMIQGGDPSGTGSGGGPRMVDAEFNSRKHEPGVLSMARKASPNSASSQFFIMQAAAPSLDGQYSVFGALVTGLDVVGRITRVPRGAGDKPRTPQVIEHAYVVQAPGDAGIWKRSLPK